MMRGLEQRVYEKELTEWALFSPKTRKLEVRILLSPSTTCQMVTENMVPDTHSDIRRGNRHKMQQGKNSRLPKKGCRISILGDFQNLLDKQPCL